MKQKIISKSDSVDKFVDQLIEAKNFGDEDPEVMDQIKSDLMERIENHINAAIIAQIPDAHAEEFGNLVEKGDFEKIKGFCEKHIPELDSLVANTMQKFAEIYLTE